MGAPFIAQYAGECEDCGEAIEPGQEVLYVWDDLEHVRCPTRRPVEVCTTCWLTKPCGCED